MRYLLFVFACAVAACGGDPSEAGLYRHMRPVDQAAGSAGLPEAGGAPSAGAGGSEVHLGGMGGQSGSAGAQAGSGSLGGSPWGGSGGAAGSPQGGAPNASSGGESPAGAAGVPSGGQAGGAGSAGQPIGGDSGTAGAAGQPAAGQGGSSGSGGSAIDYFQGCPVSGNPGAPLWQPDWDGATSATPEYIAGIPLHGQVQAACGIFTPGIPDTDRCLWVCRDAALCKQFPPDGSVHQTVENQNAWGGRPYCDCMQPGNDCAGAPH